MRCANCGLVYEEHINGFAFDERFGDGCSGYLEVDEEVLRDTHIQSPHCRYCDRDDNLSSVESLDLEVDYKENILVCPQHWPVARQSW